MSELTLLFSLLVGLSACGSKQTAEEEHQSYELPEAVQLIRANGKVIPESGLLELSAEAAGRVEKICVRSGDKVAQGDTLIILDAEMARLSLQQKQNQLKAQQNSIAVAELNVEKSKIALEQAERDHAIAKRLFEKGAETKNALQRKADEWAQKKADYEASLKNFDLAKANAVELRDNLGMAHKQVADAYVRAPNDGEVLDIEVEQGASVQPYEKLLSFALDEPLIVEAEVDELYANKLAVGQAVRVHLIGYPDVIAEGEIYLMSNFLSDKSIFSGENSEKQDRQMRKIKIRITKEQSTLLIGTKVSCDIRL